jgi:hypothetical protein
VLPGEMEFLCYELQLYDMNLFPGGPEFNEAELFLWRTEFNEAENIRYGSEFNEGELFL